MTERETDKCCGTCRYHKHDRDADSWACINPDSAYFGDYTGYDDRCMEWEKK